MIRFKGLDGDIFLDPDEFSEIYPVLVAVPKEGSKQQVAPRNYEAGIGLKNGHSFRVEHTVQEVIEKYESAGYSVWG